MAENDTNGSESCNKYAISVIMPAFNSAKFIERTLITVLAQTASNFEIIVVDDGSTDNTSEVVEQIFNASQRKDIQTRLLKKEHAGVSAARNHGLENAQGEYVMFFDSDDLMNRDCLEKFMQAVKGTNYDSVVCGIDFAHESGAIKYRYTDKFKYFKESLSGQQVTEMFLTGEIYVCVENIIYKRDLLHSNDLNYTIGSAWGEDMEFIAKALFLSGRVNCVSESLMTYIVPVGFKKYHIEQTFDRFAAFKRVHEFLVKNHASKELLEVLDTKNYPEGYKSGLVALIYSGYSVSEIAKIAKQPEIKSSFKKYKSNSFRNWLIFKTLFYMPRLFFLVAKAKKRRT